MSLFANEIPFSKEMENVFYDLAANLSLNPLHLFQDGPEVSPPAFHFFQTESCQRIRDPQNEGILKA